MTGTAVPVSGPVRNLIRRLDDRYLLVERDGPVIDVLRSSDWGVVSSIAGGLSPLRKFLITRKTDDNMFVRRHCRKTPHASESDVAPSLPSDPNLIMMQDIGWLLWTP